MMNRLSPILLPVSHWIKPELTVFKGWAEYWSSISAAASPASADCKMFGNQVNTEIWFYLLKPNTEPKLLFNSYNGPDYILDSTCNGMPDLMTSGRYSSGEHEIVYYRYNGEKYEAAYSYMLVGIGRDDNGNDMGIADLIDNKKEIICK